MAGAGKQDAETETAKGKTLFRERFKAWWEGYALAEPVDEAAPAAPPEPKHVVRYERPKQYWETSRLSLVQKVWGAGFSSPGGHDHIRSMVKILALDPAMTVLDLGAGLGGAARTMCEDFGVWVTGLEADKDLAEAGMALSTKAGMGKKVPINVFDPEKFQHPAKSVDCVFSKEFLFSVKDKMEILRTIEILLKNRGQFLFTDYVLAKRHQRSPDIQKWVEHEPRKAYPWAVEDYEEALTELHLEIRVTEDITESFQKLVTHAWADYIDSAQRGGIGGGMAPAIVDEVEIWTRRMQAMESGDIKACRMYAIKKDTEKLMSNW